MNTEKLTDPSTLDQMAAAALERARQERQAGDGLLRTHIAACKYLREATGLGLQDCDRAMRRAARNELTDKV